MPVTDKDQLKEVVRTVVLAQGNIFIKELLREHGGPLGSTKQEFLDNLERAIDEDRITGQILREWLDQVEGWGEQSVYLYTVPPALRNAGPWRDPAPLRSALGAAGFPGVWEADSSMEYPDSLKLTAVRMRDTALTFEWHRAWEKLIRLGEHQDKEEVVGNDRIYYKAYLKTGRRSVVRFQIRPRDRLAAAFLQIPATSREHAEALEGARKLVARVVPEAKLGDFDMSKVIIALDQQQLGGDGEVWTDSTRLEAPGAYVEFGSTQKDHGYREVRAIRDARETLVGKAVEGRRAVIYFAAPGGPGMARSVRAEFFGLEDRFWLRASMNEEQVWMFIRRIAALSR